MDIGVNFSPLAQREQQGSHGTAAPQVQEAIRTLSTTMPRVVGASSPIPQQLLGAAGSQGLSMAGGMENSGGLEQILRKLFGMPPMGEVGGGMSPSMAPSVSAGHSAPAPRVGFNLDGGSDAAADWGQQATDTLNTPAAPPAPTWQQNKYDTENQSVPG